MKPHVVVYKKLPEHLLQRQVDAIIVSTSLPPEHPFYQRWANDPFPIVALDRALDNRHALELMAEELRLAQEAVNEITGEFTPDDLLGVIFSRFCIGK